MKPSKPLRGLQAMLLVAVAVGLAAVTAAAQDKLIVGTARLPEESEHSVGEKRWQIDWNCDSVNTLALIPVMRRSLTN